MELEEYNRDTDVEGYGASMPLLSQVAAAVSGTQPEPSGLLSAVEGARSESSRNTASAFAGAPGEFEQQQQLHASDSREGASFTSSDCPHEGAFIGEEGVTPAMFTAARVSARLVSASGPMVAEHGSSRATSTINTRRGLRRGFSNSSESSRGDVPSFQGPTVAAATAAAATTTRTTRAVRAAAAAAAIPREQLQSSRRNSKNEASEDKKEGDFDERGGSVEGERDPEGGSREYGHSSAMNGSGLRGIAGVDGRDVAATRSVMEPENSDNESSISPGSSETGGGSSSDAVVVANPPEEIRRVLASSHNTIALLLLLLVHFMVTHIFGIMAFLAGTVVLVGLDRRLRAHTDAQVLKNRIVLLSVAVTAVFAVTLSAKFLSHFPGREGLLRGLILISPKPDRTTVSAVIYTTLVVDLWARLLSIAVKAVLSICPMSRDDGSVGNGDVRSVAGLCNRRRFTGCGHPSYRCGRRCGSFRRGGEVEWWGLRRSTYPRVGGSSMIEGDAGSSGGSSDDSRTGGGRSRFPGGARRAWRTWLCCTERCCGGPCRPGRRSSSGRYGEDGGGLRLEERGVAVDGRRTRVLLSRAGRQRRVNAVVEMASMLYRCLLPVPVWLEFYSKDSDYFSAVYLVLKGMEVSFRTDRLVRAACYVRRGDLDRGKFATPEEVSEVGSPDCSICYDRMDQPLILPCNHLFCGECVAEWLEQERTCPLCRAEVPTSNPIPKALRDGRTAIVPQIL